MLVLTNLIKGTVPLQYIVKSTILLFANFKNASMPHIPQWFTILLLIAGALSVTPVRPYVRHTKRRPLSKSNSFDQNCMKLGHIFSTRMYSTSSIMVRIAPCLQELLPLIGKSSPFYGIRYLSLVILITTV